MAWKVFYQAIYTYTYIYIFDGAYIQEKKQL